MKVRITALKTTGWPKDAKIGDVVELDATEIPGWALGKCEQVAADAEVTVSRKKAEAKKEAAK